MKWSNKKSERYNMSYHKTARGKGYKAKVVYNCYYDEYYFMTEKSGEIYNSCWDNLKFKTEDECKQACEHWIDER